MNPSEAKKWYSGTNLKMMKNLGKNTKVNGRWTDGDRWNVFIQLKKLWTGNGGNENEWYRKDEKNQRGVLWLSPSGR